MPIISIRDQIRDKAELALGKDVDFSFCSPSCLLQSLDGNARVVRTGQTSATALTVILNNERLLVPLSGSSRSQAHILGAQHGHASAKANWEKLIDCKHSALMPVYRVCDCMAETQILDGLEFEDAATTPAWKTVRGIVAKTSMTSSELPTELEQWRNWMAELAFGLDQLEKKGLAHGDPYPFNALRTASNATWVDFGHMTDDPAQLLKDAWAFALFTVLHTQRRCSTFSPTLLRKLAQALLEADQPGRFTRIGQALLQPIEDAVPMDDQRQPSVVLAQAIADHANRAFGDSAVPELLLKSATQYFSDLLHHIQRGNQYSKAFAMEQQRHVFMEQETVMRTMPKAAHAQVVESKNQVIAQRDGLIEELHQKLLTLNEQLNRQLADADRTTFEHDTDRARMNELLTQKDIQIANLNQMVQEHGQHVDHLTEVSRSHYAQLTHVLASRSWRITRPMRATARFIKWGGMTDVERGKLYNFAKRAYHRIPVSYETKLVFRKYFLKLTGWTPSTGTAANMAAAARSTVVLTNTGVKTVSPMASITGTAAGTPSSPVASLGMLLHSHGSSNRIPYFGVRRPEGQRRVAILTNQLLDWNDGRPRFGGGERYALELARLLKELSFDVTFFQPSFKAPGEGEYYGFKVVLLRTADSIGEFHYGLCSEFTAMTQDFDHVYYHLPEYASGKVREDGLMTCHGIWFDHNNYPDAIFRTPEWFQQLHSAFSSPRCVVSVDTNSIGVMRSLWPELASNMRFIPNFYDESSYHPKPESRDPDKLTILFPRRSQINRGSRIFGEILSLIPYDVRIIWLGEGDPVDTQIVKDVCKKDKRASFAVADFDQMPQWYQKADIAVIPTIACEGTSLSCIEALAVGCAVVSTNVGGLPDLVYDGMNGLLVDPDARSLAAAINRLIVDHELRTRLQKSAFETAHHFELKSWRKRWADVLHEYGWVTDKALDAWKSHQGDPALSYETRQPEKWLILTRNAIHGGVESLIREESKGLNAPVVVCGGHDRKDTCPFEYTRADDPKTLGKVIASYDVILYHWLPDWCLDVLKASGKRCIEFVHRTDTAASDKSIPAALVTHSAFLARHLNEATGRSCRVVDHPIAIDKFKPHVQKGKYVGAITSYYDTKGIDIFLEAWAVLKERFPEYGVRFYGAGDDLPKFRKLASELGLDVDFRDPTTEPWEAMKDFACFVVPSRIEGLPVAILEALAMNIPVVASDLPGMVEFNELSVARGYSSFVHLAKKEDPQDLAALIADVLNNSSHKASSSYINDYYSQQKHCSDLVSIYRELCH